MVASYVITPPSMLLYAQSVEEAVEEHRLDDATETLCKMYLSSVQLFNEGVISPRLHNETKDFYRRMMSLIIDYTTNF